MPLASRPDYTLAELLAECEASVKVDQPARCEMTEWLREHAATGTMVDFEAAVNDPANEWGAGVAAACIRDCFRYNDLTTGLEVQRLYAGYLAAMDFKRSRGHIEALLLNPPPGGPWDATALGTLVAAVQRHHRHPAEFLNQPAVRRHTAHLDAHRNNAQ